MILIIYTCDKNKVDEIINSGQLGPGNSFDNSTQSNNTFCTIALSNYMKPNPNKSYIIFNKNVIQDAFYWAPRWNSVYTSDKHRHYYDTSKNINYNLNKWVKVYKNTLQDYNPNFIYNEIGIPQNEIVFTKPIDLNQYGEWVIY